MKRRAFFTAAFGAIGALFAKPTAPATQYDYLSPIKDGPWVLGFSGFSDPERRYHRTETIIGYIHEADSKRFLEVHAELLANIPKLGSRKTKESKSIFDKGGLLSN